MDELQSFLSTPPALRFAFAVEVEVGPIQDLGATSHGHRRISAGLGPNRSLRQVFNRQFDLLSQSSKRVDPRRG